MSANFLYGGGKSVYRIVKQLMKISETFIKKFRFYKILVIKQKNYMFKFTWKMKKIVRNCKNIVILPQCIQASTIERFARIINSF